MRYLILPLLLAACAPLDRPAPSPPSPSPPAEERGSCGAEGLQRLVGAPGTALERELILGQVRIIRPGDAVTMEYRAERLNFEIDAMGRIARVNCG